MLQQTIDINLASCLEAALSYAAAAHWPVFPVAGKRPLTLHGFKDATTDVQQIRQWWRHYPEANIGIPTGTPTGLVVLDVDAHHDGLASLSTLQRQCGPLPPTRTSQTGGGGLHLLYAYAYPRDNDERHCSHLLKNATNLGGFSGIDLRGMGGYIVVPPSRHASGKGYRWLNNEPLALFPDVLLKLCNRSTSTTQRPQISARHEPSSLSTCFALHDGGYWLQQAIGRARPGTRNTTGFWLACQLRDDGVELLVASVLMQRYARTVGEGGSGASYTEQEALQSLASAYRIPPRPAARRFSR